MGLLNKKVKEVRLYKNAIVFNSNHNKNYKVKKYTEIEYFNGKIVQLDIEGRADITNCEYLKILNKGKLVKTLFQNELA